MVICEASAKFVKRSTAKMAVSPIAGTARMVPGHQPVEDELRLLAYAYAAARAIHAHGA